MSTLAKLLLFALAFALVISLIAILPTITIDKDAVVSSSAYQWIRAGLWFLPTSAVVSIATVQLSLWLFRVIVALVKVFWDMLPF